MDSKNEILDFLKTNRNYLQKRYHICKIGIFGSFARDEQNQDSDVDIIIELDKNSKNVYDLKFSLKQYLSNAFKRDVDIAREKYLKPYAKKDILKDVIYV